MAAIQSSQNNITYPIILGGGQPYVKDQETLLTDVSRTVVLAQYTIMSQIASTKKWVPWLNANLGDNTGLQYPMGILMNDGGITAAALAAGDVTGAQILVGGAGVRLDFSQLVFDKGSTGGGTPNTVDSVATVPTGLALRAEAILNMKGLFVQQTVVEDLAEN